MAIGSQDTLQKSGEFLKVYMEFFFSSFFFTEGKYILKMVSEQKSLMVQKEALIFPSRMSINCGERRV